MRKNQLSEIELLAPAGNMASALAAFDAGADAVYCGLKQFNARERSENFTVREMAKLIEYAHRNGKRVHVTFNTLVRESELLSAAESLAVLTDLRPDAVIVQDIGIVSVIRDFFPDLVIHASTQMGIHNSAGLESACAMGVKRVILERQVTLGEISAMTGNGTRLPLELEVFVHGALCCCLSGSCLFSSWLGGWSGNRGKCKQPCRRRYFNAADPVEKQGAFLFSPDDLCAVDLLEEFRKAGVCSFKIEGRLRRADYVSRTVSAYRRVMDASPEHRARARKEAKEILRGAYTRKLSLGFYTADSAENLVRRDAAGPSGLYCGRVVSARPDGFSALLTKRLHVGDTIRVQALSDSGDGTTLSVLRLLAGGKPVMKALPGETCFIGTEKQVPKDALIYKTGESSSDYAKRIAALPEPRIPLDLEIAVSRGIFSVTVRNLAREMHWETSAAFSEALKNPLQCETLREEFSASASERFSLGECRVRIAENPFVPAGELKKIRRAFWQWADAAVTRENAVWKGKDALEKFIRFYRSRNPERQPLFPDCAALGKNMHGSFAPAAARELADVESSSEEVILPSFVPEGGLDSLRSSIRERILQGSRVFRITSLFQFALLKESGVTLRTTFPFPAANSFAVLECRRLGASGVQAWIELGAGDLRDLSRHAALPLELYAYGRPPLLATRATLPVAYHGIADVRNNRFSLRKNGILTMILPERPLKIEGENAYCSHFIDLRHARLNEPETSEFNFRRGLS